MKEELDKGKRLFEQELRYKFIEFFVDKGYSYFEHNSIQPPVEKKDIFFVNAGIVPVLELINSQSSGRHFSIQGCLRLSGKHNDLEEIGLSHSHHTFFEMAGHFVWGTSEDLTNTLRDAIDFLLSVDVPKERLFLTYHPDMPTISDFKASFQDLEWREDLTNVWSAGKTGHRGYCVEIYLGDDLGDLELWNCVYVNEKVDEDGTTVNLKDTYLDSGLGLARLISVLEGHRNTYRNQDLLYSKSVLETFHTSLDDRETNLIVDHLRSVYVLYMNGIDPTHQAKGYVLKKLIRKVSWIFLTHEKEITIDLLTQIFRTYYQIESNRLSFENTLKLLKRNVMMREPLCVPLHGVILSVRNEFLAATKIWRRGERLIDSLNLIGNVRRSDIVNLIEEKGIPLDLVRRKLKGFENLW